LTYRVISHCGRDERGKLSNGPQALTEWRHCTWWQCAHVTRPAYTSRHFIAAKPPARQL